MKCPDVSGGISCVGVRVGRGGGGEGYVGGSFHGAIFYEGREFP